MSAAGRFVAFESLATNLDRADRDRRRDVYLRDRKTRRTELISRASGADGAKANSVDGSEGGLMSGDGRYVTFTSSATNLDPGDADATSDVYVRDRLLNTTTLVSRASGEAGAKADRRSAAVAISSDGRLIAFATDAANVTPGVAPTPAGYSGLPRWLVYVRDLRTHTTMLVSRADGVDGMPAYHSLFRASISSDNRYVGFSTTAALDPADGDRRQDVYVRDLLAGATTLVSRASGVAGTKVAARGFGVGLVGMSGDGRHVFFSGSVSNLPGSRPRLSEVWVRNLETHQTALAGDARSRPAFTSGGPGAISSDGRFMGFETYSPKLDPRDSVGRGEQSRDQDVFIRDLKRGRTFWVTSGRREPAEYGLGPMSADGRSIVVTRAPRGFSFRQGQVYVCERSPRQRCF